MRIISGKYRGRRLDTVSSDDVRPTTDRVREALFSHLGNHISGARVLDLFAGSGALGLESLSRDAAFAVFVERSRKVFSFLQKNVENMDAGSCCSLVCMDAIGYLKKNGISADPFDLIFLDPPYDGPWLAAALQLLGERDMLALNGIIVAEHRAAFRLDKLNLHPALQIIRTKQYGKTTITTIGASNAR
ncbi:MAG: 16S rRNA (guanine(966)-N(2))-methyltransferase RsmD [Deltaproteobacteria bacterium]|nr:16S rRNA (guanine(966)-N(2))-methyltransferase RsmD [Deltaproteobacteria bacterium]MBN2674628.1 16S rRNA (guanine(966)-N(2))-methyltransferase RsmD [Deltaproteobacteria bacterium]